MYTINEISRIKKIIKLSRYQEPYKIYLIKENCELQYANNSIHIWGNL